ncbi:hypothetical protein [Burkholderia plantarii]|uniref:hypothetical protein n=1 Tax=Burkholderia plantarii TaxID=41899 RepID=UPI0018DDD6CF|nr:hypothetical protein [Burkholderia plantarii]MBI0327674.1 hypothetical protein [Burkholderia plantarii]
MPELHSIAYGGQSFNEYVDALNRRQRFPPGVLDAWQYANDTLDMSCALAKARFGDAATPEHALAIFQTVTADIARRADMHRTDTE